MSGPPLVQYFVDERGVLRMVERYWERDVDGNAFYAAAAVDPRLAEFEKMKKLRPMYPIQNGPSVPWEVMAPHEGAAQRLHSQSLARLAERGGLGTGEAWCVVNGIIHKSLPTKADWDAWDKAWRDYAERINLHYDQLATLQAELTQARDERNEFYNATVTLTGQRAASQARVQALRKAAHDVLKIWETMVNQDTAYPPYNKYWDALKAALAQEAT